ncbi:MAG TPA: hypothetical protein VF581_08235 [Flavobacterium sp.]|jgi:hypothetical protein
MKSFKITLITLSLLAFINVAAQQSTKAAPKFKEQTTATAAPKLKDPVTNCNLRYYYYPNLEAYYDVKLNIYYFLQDGKWTTATDIPKGYRGYGMYNKCRTAITDYDDEDPTQFLKIHKKQYPYAPTGKIKNMMASVD